MFNRYNKKTTTTTNRLTIVDASDIENEAEKKRREEKRKKTGEGMERKKTRRQRRKREKKKKEIGKEKRTECDSNELTIYNTKKKRRKSMIDCVCECVCCTRRFSNISTKEREKRRVIEKYFYFSCSI